MAVHEKAEEELPLDIISEILLRIPADILNSMRLVCHTWSNLILSRYFVDTHLLRSEPGILILEKDNESDKFESHFMDIENGQLVKRDLSCTFSQRVLLGNCNGLIFIGNADAHLGFHDLCVVNLATKKSISLPSLPYPNSSTRFHLFSAASTTNSIKLPAHPYSTFSASFGRYDSVSCGLTFVPSTNEYKASINFFRKSSLATEEDSSLCESRILTLGTNTWRELFFPLEDQVVLLFGSSISVGGVMYFRATIEDSERRHYVISLDLVSEKLEKTYLPDDLHIPDRTSYFECWGFLSFVDYEVNAGKFDIWILKDFRRKKWEKTYTSASIDNYKSRFCIYRWLFRPILSLKNGKLIVFMQSTLSQDPFCLYAYDVEKQEMKMLGMETNGLNQYSVHVNNLASWE